MVRDGDDNAIDLNSSLPNFPIQEKKQSRTDLHHPKPPTELTYDTIFDFQIARTRAEKHTMRIFNNPASQPTRRRRRKFVCIYIYIYIYIYYLTPMNIIIMGDKELVTRER